MRLLLSALALSLFVGCAGDDDDDGDDQTGQDRSVGADVDGGIAEDTGVDDDAGVTADTGPNDTGPVDAGLIDPQQEPFRTLMMNGTPETRIDIVIVGDGYTQEELGTTYAEHADRVVGRMFSTSNRSLNQPFRTYRSYFNVHRVHLASNESGIDDPANGVTVDTALDGTTACTSSVTGPCQIDFDKAHAAIDAAMAGSGIVPDWRVVVLNTDAQAGGAYLIPAGNLAVYGGGYGASPNITRDVGMREIAVAHCGAGYEFGGTGGFGPYTGPEPAAPNVTTDPGGAKWARWAGFDQNNDGIGPVGAFEGAGGFNLGLYRPTEISKMGAADDGETYNYNAVAREAIVLAIYRELDLVLDHLDNSQPLTDPDLLQMDLLSEATVEWTVDGTVVDGIEAGSFGFSPWADANALGPGTYSVAARAFDDTGWVRTSSRTGMEQTVVWTVERTRGP